MPSHTTTDIRNLALAGHAGTGKTTLAEALLHRAGAIPNPGSVKQGTTISDFDPQEKHYQHSINASLMSMEYQGCHINLIDTPGMPDFSGRAISVMPAVETVAVVIGADTGVDSVAQRMMEAAGGRGLCRILIVNRIDAGPPDSWPALLAQIREAFGTECLPVNLPRDNGREVVDCFFNPGGGDTDLGTIEEAHTGIVDQVVEVDEALMEVYLEQGQELDPAQLHDPFEKALRDGHLIPVCFASAETGAGIEPLLDVLARLMPNPAEGNPPPFLRDTDDGAVPVEIMPDPDRHVLAHVFKVVIDPFVGRMGIFRIHQGTVTRDSQLFIGDGRKPFKVGHLLALQGKDSHEIDAGIPGDICAVAKQDDIHFDAVLHDSHEEDHIHLKSMDCPAPMYGLAIAARSRGDEQKISDALAKLDAEDPCFRVEHNAATNETVIRGLGDLHLRVMLERMKERFNVEVDTREPSIAYRETISAKADGHYRHKKQTGGAGQFGEVSLTVEPLPRGQGFEFVNRIVGGVIPAQFIPAVEKGVRQAMDAGAISGHPMQDIRVTVHDGKHHSVDSKEVAFVTAGKKAFLQAVGNARPLVMEPIVALTVTAPGASMGDITGDLAAKRGKINGTDSLANGMVTIRADVPLGELGNYQSELKAATAGEGSYTIQFSHYAPVPPRLQQELVSKYRPADHED